MGYSKRLTSLAIAAAMLIQPAFSVFAESLSSSDSQTARNDKTSSPVLEEHFISSEADKLNDFVFEGDTLPCSQNDPSYHKYINSAGKARAAWGSGNLVHHSRFDNYTKVYGIDVSYYQQYIDWDAVKASGIKYVIVRAGYRGYGNGKLVLDDNFHYYIQGAQAAGLKVGAYFFTQAINTAEAEQEAKFVLDNLKGYTLDLPVYYDIENIDYDYGRLDGAGLSYSQKTALCETFCQTIEAGGFDAGIYANKWWLTSLIDGDSLGSKYSIWNAEYGTSMTYTGPAEMWQYTGNGYVDGISTIVDMNVFYASKEKPDKVEGLNAAASDSTHAVLSWTAVDGCTGYKVYKKTLDTEKVTLVATTHQTTAKIELPDDNCKFYIRAYRDSFGTIYYGNASDPVLLCKNKVMGLTAEKVETTSVSLTWEKLSAASGYSVYVYDTVTKEFRLADRVNTESYKVTGLCPGRVYKFKVRAYFNSDGSSKYSAAKSVYGIYSDPITCPMLPSGVKGAKMLSNSTASVTLTWNKNSSGCDGYDIASYDPATKKYTVIAASETTSKTIAKLQSATDCYFAVRAYYMSGGKKITGHYTMIKCATKPEIPGNFRCATKSDTECKLAWDKSERATGYKLYEVTDSGKKLIARTTGTSYTIKNLAKNSKHTYSIVAYRSFNGKEWNSYSDSVTVTLAKEAPSNIAVYAYATTAVRIKWEPVMNAQKYRVYLYDTTAKKYKRLADITDTKYRIAGLTANKSYKIKVASMYKDGTVKVSPEQTIYTKPVSPTGLKITSKTKNSVSLSWNKVSGATGYRIKVYNSKGQYLYYYDAGAKTSCTISDLSMSTKYYFKAVAVKHIIIDYISEPCKSVSTTTNGPTYYKKTSYTGVSLVEGLASIGVTCNYTLQKKIAAANGITNYSGTAAQNTKMLNLLKQGKLIKP